jgi:AraC-like DNA-binding protein
VSASAKFESATDRRAYAVVATGAAVLSYYHARMFFLPFMGKGGATVTPLLLDAVVYWLATACIRQAAKGRPLPMLRTGAYVLLALSVTANALGGATWPERVFMALPAALFGFLTEVQIRLAADDHRAAHGDDRLGMALWLRHPFRAARAKLWQARRRASAFDLAEAERDKLAAARDAVRLALPGRSKSARRARRGVLRELNAGRLAPRAAVAASGLLDLPEVPPLHRAALVAALGDTADPAALTPPEADAIRAEVADTIADAITAMNAALTGTTETLRSAIDATQEALREEIAAAARRQALKPASQPSAGTADRIARLTAKHPDLTAQEIAARLGISARTVRRYTAAAQQDTPDAA